MDTRFALKVVSAWVTIVYAVCFFVVALVPGVRPLFMRYALHTETTLGVDVLTLGTFVWGIVIWNVIAVLAVLLFTYLYNSFKRS